MHLAAFLFVDRNGLIPDVFDKVVTINVIRCLNALVILKETVPSILNGFYKNGALIVNV